MASPLKKKKQEKTQEQLREETTGLKVSNPSDVKPQVEILKGSEAERVKADIQGKEVENIKKKIANNTATSEDIMILKRRDIEARRAEIQRQIDIAEGRTPATPTQTTTIQTTDTQQLPSVTAQQTAQPQEGDVVNVEQKSPFGNKLADLPFTVNKEGKPQAGLNTLASLPSAGAQASLSTPEARIIAKSGAEVIDAVTSVLSARKQADVLTAENSFNDARIALKDDLERIKRGEPLAYDIAKKNLERMKSAHARLRDSQKGLGMLNLRYWLGGGAEVEAEIEIFNEDLAQARLDIEQAKLDFTASQQARVQSLRDELANLPIT